MDALYPIDDDDAAVSSPSNPNNTAQAWTRALADTAGTEPGDNRGDDAALAGLGGAAGRDTYIGAQINQAEGAARNQPATDYSGDLFRAVDPKYASTYSNHSFSSPGRYNAPGQSALYTAPTQSDVAAEAGNYGGLNNRAVVRANFDGSLLDLRSLPGVNPSALTEGYGSGGSKKSPLMKLTGEDPYTLPRAVGDVARTRSLSGVIAPANDGNTNIALFPDDPNPPVGSGPGRIASNLSGLDTTAYDAAGTPGAPARFNTPPANIPDATPNKFSPLATDRATGSPIGPKAYGDAVAADADAHGRAGGARYGAAGGAAVSLIEGVATGHLDGKQIAANTVLGAASGHAETSLAQSADRYLLRPPSTPPNVAGSATLGVEENAARSALRPPSFAATVGSAGVVGAVVGGGVEAWNDADLVRDGKMSAGQATADVAVQAGVGLGAGMTGAAAGAAVGSVVPVAGTAVGAVVGFGVGMATSWVAQHSGFVDGAEKAAGKFLTDHFEQPLEGAWHGVAAGVDATKSAINGGVSTVEHAASGLKNAASSAWRSIFG